MMLGRSLRRCGLLWGVLMLLAEVQEHRQQLMQVTGLAVADATAYASSIVDESPERFSGEMREAAASIVATYGAVAAEGAALFYETQRPQPGFSARVAEPSLGEVLAGELGWAFLPMFAPDSFSDPVVAMLERVGGVVQRQVAAGDRQTLILSSSADPTAYGVRRFARPGACAFCAYLTTVEATVYEHTDWHRNCHCVSVPWWEDNPLPESAEADRAAEAVGKARETLLRLQREEKRPGERWRNFYKRRPDLAVNTKNITALMRRDLGLDH